MKIPSNTAVNVLSRAIPDRDLLDIDLNEIPTGIDVKGLADLALQGGEPVLSAIFREIHEGGSADGDTIDIKGAVKSLERIIEDSRAFIRALLAVPGCEVYSPYR